MKVHSEVFVLNGNVDSNTELVIEDFVSIADHHTKGLSGLSCEA